MNQILTEALAELRRLQESQPFNVERYRVVCEMIIEHRNDLTYQVYINTPENADPKWARVREGSVARCDCGCDRVILPGNPRTEFVATEGEPMVLRLGDDKIYLKPKGGDKQSTYMALWVVEAGQKGKMLCYMGDPFAPLVLSVSMFSTPGVSLTQLAEVLPKQIKPPVMFTGKDTPVFAIMAVDPEAGTITVVLDQAVECLTKEEIDRQSTHQH